MELTPGSNCLSVISVKGEYTLELTPGQAIMNYLFINKSVPLPRLKAGEF